MNTKQLEELQDRVLNPVNILRGMNQMLEQAIVCDLDSKIVSEISMQLSKLEEFVKEVVAREE